MEANKRQTGRTAKREAADTDGTTILRRLGASLGGHPLASRVKEKRACNVLQMCNFNMCFVF